MSTPINASTVPEIWYKAKRVIRTIIAVIVSILLTIAAAVLALNAFAPQILTELGKVLPAGWVAWLTAVLALLVTVAGVITRIMAIPQVNAWLTKIGAGSVPASTIIDARATNDVSSLPPAP